MDAIEILFAIFAVSAFASLAVFMSLVYLAHKYDIAHDKFHAGLRLTRLELCLWKYLNGEAS